MVMLVIMVMGVAAILASSLNTAALKVSRQETTATVLAQAKDALVGYAVRDDNRPGELPCPDYDNDGAVTVADYSGSNCQTLLGYLPWKTLGLPDLRDDSGERLWYAVSEPFHANDTAVLNSDTAGTLAVSGNLSAGNVIAIIFAPGKALPGQDRSTANINTPGAFLESIVSAPTSFRLLTQDDQSGGGFTYNDQLMLLTRDALFPAVEKIVAKRVRNELLRSSRAFWRPYPYAAPFNNPSSQNSFVAAAGTLYGLLPRHAVWAGLPSVSLSGGSAAWSCELRENTTISLNNARLRCTFYGISSTPVPFITLTGTMTPSLGLWRQYDLSSSGEVRIRVKGVSCAAPDSGSSNTVDCAAASVPGVNAAISYAVNTDGSVAVTFSGRLISAISRIELRDAATDPAYGWFAQNEWHKVMYYAVSPGYNAGGSASCTGAPPACLKLDDSENIGALVVAAGSALAGKSHPSGVLGDYLEGTNANPSGFLYKNSPRSGAFNDQVIAVAP
jgi:hypothetical protein